MLLLLFAKSWVNGYTRGGKFVAGYNRSGGAGAGQASFDFYAGKPLRSGTVNAQRDAGHAAANDLLGWSARRAGASLLRTRFPENFRDAGFANLIGRHVETSLDLAAVAQVCRDPRFETLRILFCDVQGNVVGQSAVTSRLPAVLQFATPQEFGPMLERLDALASQYGASHYWLTHNHPNGSATPSKEDVRMTQAIAERIPGFAGHVVINSSEYATIDRHGHVTVQKRELSRDTYTFRPPTDGLGENVWSASRLADYAKTLQVRPEFATVISIANGLTHSIAEYPEKAMRATTDRGRLKAVALLRRMARAAGADNGLMMVVRGDVQRYRYLVESGVVVDVVNAETGRTLRAQDKTIKPGPVWALGGRIKSHWTHDSAS